MKTLQTISAIAFLALTVSAAVRAGEGEPAIAERPIHRVSAIAIVAPAHTHPTFVLIDLYPNRHDGCTDILSRGTHDAMEAAIHRENDGWRFESGRLIVHAPKILLFGERSDGNGYRWVGERRLRADDEIEADLP